MKRLLITTLLLASYGALFAYSPTIWNTSKDVLKVTTHIMAEKEMKWKPVDYTINPGDKQNVLMPFIIHTATGDISIGANFLSSHVRGESLPFDFGEQPA